MKTNPTVSWRLPAAMARWLLGTPGEPEPPATPTPSEPTPGEEKMKSRGPVLTLVAIVSLALVLLGINVAAEPAPTATPAAASAPAAAPEPPPSPTPTAAEVAEPEPPAFPAEAAYAGRTSGDELTVAVAVKDGRAVAYICDGEQVEAWLEGTVEGTALTLTGDDGASVTGELVDDALFGLVDATGKQWPYAAQIAAVPAGTYRGAVSVRGVQKRIGWNVLQDGTVTGLASDGTPAPPLDLETGTATLDGTPVAVAPITGNDDVTG